MTIQKPKPSVCSFESFIDILEKVLRQPVWEPLYGGKSLIPNIRYSLLYKLVPSTDIVLSIFCEGWSSCAREWITRDRLWPNIKLVNEIAQSGFHIVPKTSSQGDFWLSFSIAESTLVKSLTHLQHRAIRAFKAVVKYHQRNWSPDLSEILSSYHLKTIAFWHFEKSSQQSWTEETVVHHLLTLFEELAEALRIRDIPMYFMPKVNLLQDVTSNALLDIVEKISSITSDIPGICEALDDKITLKGIYITEADRVRIVDTFNTIRKEKLEKAGEEENECTWYDVVTTLSCHGSKFCKENVIRFLIASAAFYFKFM